MTREAIVVPDDIEQRLLPYKATSLIDQTKTRQYKKREKMVRAGILSEETTLPIKDIAKLTGLSA